MSDEYDFIDGNDIIVIPVAVNGAVVQYHTSTGETQVTVAPSPVTTVVVTSTPSPESGVTTQRAQTSSPPVQNVKPVLTLDLPVAVRDFHDDSDPLYDSGDVDTVYVNGGWQNYTPTLSWQEFIAATFWQTASQYGKTYSVIATSAGSRSWYDVAWYSGQRDWVGDKSDDPETVDLAATSGLKALAAAGQPAYARLVYWTSANEQYAAKAVKVRVGNSDGSGGLYNSGTQYLQGTLIPETGYYELTIPLTWTQGVNLERVTIESIPYAPQYTASNACSLYSFQLYMPSVGGE